MSEKGRLIQIGKRELLSWVNSVFEKELSWNDFSDGNLILSLCFTVWPSLNNMKTGIDGLSDCWRQVEAIFRTLSIDYSKLIDEYGIKNNKLSSTYNALVIFFFLYHCAFKRESSFEFVPPPNKQIADFLTGDSSVKSLIVGGSLQLSPKTQIRLFETDSKPHETIDKPQIEEKYIMGGAYYDKVQRFGELIEMDDKMIKLMENLNIFFEGLNEKLGELNNEEVNHEIGKNSEFNRKIRHCIEYCVKQFFRTMEEQAIERESYDKKMNLIEDEYNQKINKLKLEYEDKILEIENEYRNKLIQEKKSSQLMLRTLQSNQTLNLQISNSVYINDANSENKPDNKFVNDTHEIKFDSQSQLKYLQEIMKEENKKRDEMEKILNEEIKSYKIENRKLRSIIFRYVTDISTNTPLFERMNNLNDQLVKIYTMAELWWKKMSGNKDNIQERIDINYKMERMRIDKMIGHIKHIIDRYQQHPKTLNKIGLDQYNLSDSGFDIEVLIQNNNLVNDCLKVMCDLLSDTLLKSNRIDQLKEFIMNTKSEQKNESELEEDNCYCSSNDTFGDVYGKLVCSEEKKQLKEKVKQLNHEKLLLKKGIEYLKKKAYTLKNQKLLLSSIENDGNFDLMSDIEGVTNNSSENNENGNIIEISKLWEMSNYLKEDGINELDIMSEFMAIINSWKNFLTVINKENDSIDNNEYNLSLKEKVFSGDQHMIETLKSDFTVKSLGIVPFITNSNKLLEIALDNGNFIDKNVLGKGKVPLDDFDFESDFDKEVEMISKMALKKEIGAKIRKEEINKFPLSLKKVEILFWKLVTCLHVLREEYEMIHNHSIELEKRIELLINKMEEEKTCYLKSTRDYREKHENEIKNLKSQLLNEIGKLKAEIALNKINKYSEFKNWRMSDNIELAIREGIKNSNIIINSLSNALEISNIYRYIYEVCDDFWNDIMYKIKDKINKDDMDKINTILSQMNGVKDYLKEYAEKGYNGEERDIGEYITSKVMEIRDNNDIKSNTINVKMSNFLKDLAIRNNIPLDWMHFIELLVNTKTAELNGEITILNDKINVQQNILDGIKQNYTEVSNLNNHNEFIIEKVNSEYKILEERLNSVIGENENLRSNCNVIKDKFKELDIYYTKQLINSNKKLNRLEKICMLSMKYQIELSNFSDFYFINDSLDNDKQR
ncbi:coiled coil protein [Cryptosporidium ryanae]|uniref:coiled coil protein n=1 Tax=Cryptosporidium ryanae TaxID=515981 RepID=UPI00351A918E|nr:coiled coil protein [Cryptosporidium ryanae]